MAKASITRKDALNANGILSITDNGIAIENTDTGELIDLKVLLSDFADICGYGRWYGCAAADDFRCNKKR